jgi:hypothetical protein
MLVVAIVRRELPSYLVTAFILIVAEYGVLDFFHGIGVGGAAALKQM